MNGLTVHLIPDDLFQNKDLQILLRQITELLKAKEVMHTKEVAEFLGVSVRTVHRLSTEGRLPYHTIEGLEGKLYLRSELINKVKNS